MKRWFRRHIRVPLRMRFGRWALIHDDEWHWHYEKRWTPCHLHNGEHQYAILRRGGKR